MTIHLFGNLKGAAARPFDLNIFMTALHQKSALPNSLVTKSLPVVAREGLKLPVMIVGLKD